VLANRKRETKHVERNPVVYEVEPTLKILQSHRISTINLLNIGTKSFPSCLFILMQFVAHLVSVNDRYVAEQLKTHENLNIHSW